MASVLDPLDVPNLTLEELRDVLDYDEDIPVTLRQLKYAVLRGELVPTKLSNKNYFSKRDGLDWVASRKGVKRAKSQPA